MMKQGVRRLLVPMSNLERRDQEILTSLQRYQTAGNIGSDNSIDRGAWLGNSKLNAHLVGVCVHLPILYMVVAGCNPLFMERYSSQAKKLIAVYGVGEKSDMYSVRLLLGEDEISQLSAGFFKRFWERACQRKIRIQHNGSEPEEDESDYHAVDLGFRDVIVEGDSKAVISKLSSETTDYSEISALVWEVKGNARGLHACTYRHIHQSGNKTAHLLATLNNEDEDNRFWVEEAPRSVEEQASEDVRSYALPVGTERVLDGEVSDNEVKEALFRQGKDKSLGPDGFTSWFFKVAWGIVHSDFLNAVSQSAFVKGRSITDNTLLAQEIVKGYSRRNLSPRCSIKIDLQKAFDSISWNFLLNVLRAMGLPARFCGWIETCVTTPRYSIALNGNLVGLLDVAARNGIFRFHPRCRMIFLTHLCFADDLLLFCHGYVDSVLGVTSILEKFYHLSRLKLNALKTELYVCGINGGELEQIQAATGFRTGQLPVRYLGVPLVTRKLSRKHCTALLERIKAKLRLWSSKNLSFGGRLQLIKAVLFSIFNYWSRQLILPKGVIQDIERLCMRYFWKGNDSPARGARVSWNQICSIKSEGGLGLKSLTCWNKTCCFMLVRNILVGEGSLWVAWIKAYCFKLDDYWNVVNKPHFSWILRKLIKLREEARGLFPASGSWLQAKGGWIWNNIGTGKAK
ncbi:uncharacterized protein LOC120143162 [Hibiscus syriacus]|uniref:uncharacterized protein LOC120143162 n=1 Tax=Hibiscus syriacus TaxID=106335 RepID=UPI001922845C|nr:uncharacterized protein LOC120143162 [Hibiscus syriacus]